MRQLFMVVLVWSTSLGVLFAQTEETVVGPWIRGRLNGVPAPVWGFADGLRVGLSPLPGPRGLLRVYAPYLNQHFGRVINFIAVEPIPRGSSERGLSELEFSRLDNTHGIRFWSADAPDAVEGDSAPTAGILEDVQGEKRLSVYIHVEPFENGAHVYLKLTFRAGRPHEVGIAAFAREDSTPLDRCIITATMGNYARLRQLQLAERTVLAGDLWPDHSGDGFTSHARFALRDLARTSDGCAIAAATTDEVDPTAAKYAEGTRRHWRYTGLIASQSWKSCNPDPNLEVWVNGRTTYWASQDEIPGGVSFENFEMVSPFKSGEEFIFSVEPIVAESPTRD